MAPNIAYPRQRKWRKKHPEKFAALNRRLQRKKRLAKYGLTLAQFDTLLESQGGVCKLCQTAPTTNNLSVDHCHESKRVRGLLCFPCNRFYVGKARDKDWQLYERIVIYLKDSFDGRTV